MEEINDLVHVRELLRSKGANVNRRDRARKADVPIDLIERIYRPNGKTWAGMPSDTQIEQIARYAGCTPDEVYRAFEQDRYPARKGGLYDGLNQLLLQILAQPAPEQAQTVEQLWLFLSLPEEQRREIGSFVAKIAEAVE